MALRFSLAPPKTLLELFERIRELLPQLEPKVLHDIPVATTETAVAHGLGYTPQVVYPPLPHCLTIVCQERPPDDKNIYLRASVDCVCDVRVN